MSSLYALGRKVEELRPPWRSRDATFSSKRVDEDTIDDGEFEHCTFANVGFLRSKVERSHFLNCTFIDCYFRRAKLQNSTFVGCRFIDCNFDRIEIVASGFSYSIFRGCFISIDELLHNLPSQPNVRKLLTHNLFVESRKLGFSAEARKYRLQAIAAQEAHLKAAIRADSQWYRDHFDGPARILACGRLVVSVLNGFFWGYGENARRLLGNVLALSLFVFPVCYYVGSALEKLPSADSATVSFLECVWFSLLRIFPTGLSMGIGPTGPLGYLLAYFESIIGLLALALFASHIFRWSLSR